MDTKYIQLKDSYDSKTGDIWALKEQHSSGLICALYENQSTKVLEKIETLEDNPEWFQLIEEKKEDSWPSTHEGDVVFYISDDGSLIGSFFFDGGERHLSHLKTHNAFKTRNDAEMELLRRESRAQAWMPEFGDQAYIVRLYDGTFEHVEKFGGFQSEKLNFLIGNVHRNKESAKAWRDKYLPAFQCLFK